MSKPQPTLSESLESAVEPSPEPWLFVIFRAGSPLAPPSRHLLTDLDEVAIGRADRSEWRRDRRHLTLGLDDPRASTTQARLQRFVHEWVVEDLGSRNGTLVNGVPVRRAVLADGDLIETGHTFLRYRELERSGEVPPDVTADPDEAPSGLVTLDPMLAHAFARLRLVAASREAILVLGESGTGKELIARAVHTLSRRAGPLVPVNCGALPESMIEAELFGHRRGSFSGASANRTGLMRAADGGTLFLDEIGDLRPGSQAALLRALQEQQVTPIGEERPVDVDLRVVCATHRALERRVASGDFREDLLARVRGFVLHLPALRERREDLGLLVAALLHKLAGAQARLVRFSGRAARALLAHAWPQNVRELEKAIGTALALANGGPIRLEHLPEAVQETKPLPHPAAEGPMDRERLIELLRAHQGNVTAVARACGKARTQVQRWLARFDIDAVEYRS
jgi:DNA-binding NtrC family response regulator